jgi:transcriptional regulator with XRE-family HTH domain
MEDGSRPPFGEVLRRYRQAAGLSQEELGLKADLSTPAISALERGVNQRPRKATLSLLAEALDLTAEERQVLEEAAQGALPPLPLLPLWAARGATSPDGQPVNPYKGLRAFQEEDAPDFFGREALTARLGARLAETGPLTRFLVVVGPSGSGKSSVVRAGLIPALQRDALPGGSHGAGAAAAGGTGGRPVARSSQSSSQLDRATPIR